MIESGEGGVGMEGKGMAEKGVLCGARFCTEYSALKGRKGNGINGSVTDRKSVV